MTKILDGKIARDFYKSQLIERVKALPCTPTLALIQIGNNKESNIYVRQKLLFGQAIGAHVHHIRIDETESENSVMEIIKKLNRDTDVHGIIIQLPLPAHIHKHRIINTIDPHKDVDGLTEHNQSLLGTHTPHIVPATARGVDLLLSFYRIPVEGKHAVVFGRSALVGHPIAQLLKQKGARVSVCHSQTPNPKEISKTADIVIVAIGKPEYIDETFIKRDAVVIDVGINAVTESKQNNRTHKLIEEIPRRRVVGDVNFARVSPLVSSISPVPGGVGPMTVLSLFDTLIVSAEHWCRKN